jgi:perosamine synthetase
MRIVRIINYLWQNVKRIILNKNYWGFIKGHDYLTLANYNDLSALITKPDNAIRKAYEKEFSSYLGIGQCLSFAGGRMAFYTLLKCFNVNKGDEVILTGFTCSVMVNAVIRAGAIPVYADIDPETYGSSPADIELKITGKTKVIVAQHSFGIPCKIDLIKQIAKNNNLFLIEDCALSFTSTYKGIKLGNWGDAAIFSTDHSKPINTLTGGILYTLDESLFNMAEKLYDTSPELSVKHQRNILKQIWVEKKYCNSTKYAVYKLLSLFGAIKDKVFKENITFLSDDNYAKVKSLGSYAYPSKMPVFLCHLGLMELARFTKTKVQRIEALRRYMEMFSTKSDSKYILPKCYFDPVNEIVPLRFVFQSRDSGFENRLSDFVDTSWIWFKQPIVATTDPLSYFGYEPGACPVSESMGDKIINLPCIVGDEKLFENVETIL